MLHMAQRNCGGHTFKYYIHPNAQLPYFGLYEVFASMSLHLLNPLLSRSTSVFSFTKSSTKLFLCCMGFHCHPSQSKELMEHSLGGWGQFSFLLRFRPRSHISRLVFPTIWVGFSGSKYIQELVQVPPSPIAEHWV